MNRRTAHRLAFALDGCVAASGFYELYWPLWQRDRGMLLGLEFALFLLAALALGVLALLQRPYRLVNFWPLALLTLLVAFFCYWPKGARLIMYAKAKEFMANNRMEYERNARLTQNLGPGPFQVPDKLALRGVGKINEINGKRVVRFPLYRWNLDNEVSIALVHGGLAPEDKSSELFWNWVPLGDNWYILEST